MHRGLCARLGRDNVDTDQIVPKQFLKRTDATGYGEILFFDWRYDADGTPRPDFELNDPAYQGATVLVTGCNFGCGSSREHAVWALRDMGYRVLIASSFADIFTTNAYQNGLLPLVLPEAVMAHLLARVGKRDGYQVEVDLEVGELRDAEGLQVAFVVDGFWRECLLCGRDPLERALAQEEAIGAYEMRRSRLLPTTTFAELTSRQ